MQFPKNDLVIITETAEKLMIYGETILSLELKHGTDDHLAFMCVTFCRRQMEHMKGLIALFNNQCYQDMLNIARSMLEGLAILHSGFIDKFNVPLRWRAFCWVTDYRIALKKVNEGIIIDEESKHRIKSGLEQYAKPFLKKNMSIKVDFKSDPFIARWDIDSKGKRISLKQQFIEMNASALYEVYKDMSDWNHWSIRGIGIITHREENEFSFNYKNMQNAKYAFTNGILAFTESFKWLDGHMKLGTNKERTLILNEYLEGLTINKKSK